MNTAKWITALFAFFAAHAGMCSNIVPSHLRVEHMYAPTCVDVPAPRLSWINDACGNAHGETQTAYRIAVASSASNLSKGIYDAWDSGRVTSDVSTLVAYSGKALLPAKDYYWKVMVWDKNGAHSEWSKPSRWGMGLLDRDNWKASWISTQQSQGAPLLRKTFETRGRVRQAKVFVSAGGYFELYLNGRRVGDDCLSPNFTNYTERPDLQSRSIAIENSFTAYRVLYMAYDITSELKNGKNCIGTILGDGFYRCSSRWVSQYGQPCMICQIEIEYADGSRQTVVSDGTWTTKPSAIIINGVYDGEIYDARRETPRWSETACSNEGWTAVDVVKGPIGELTAQTSPSDKVTEKFKPISFTRQGDGTYLVDFGKEIAGWIRVSDTKGTSGDTLEVKYICESPLGVQKYIYKGKGRESYAPRFTWFVFSKAIIKSPSRILPSQVMAEAVNTQVDIDSDFHTSMPLLNSINDIWRRSQTDNMHGGIASDCPHRERSAYTGDGQIACATVMLNFDAAAFYQKWIRDIREAQNPNTGYVPNGAPWQPTCGGGVAWGAAINIMPWEYYLQYGDRKMLSDNIDAMAAYVNYLMTWVGEDGTMHQQMTDFGTDNVNYWMNLGDWSPAYAFPDDRLVHTFYLWQCAHNTSLAAGVLGKDSVARVYNEIAERTRRAFHSRFYNPETMSYGDYGANIFALYMGGMDDLRRQQVRTTLRKEIMETYKGHINTGFIAAKYFFETLSENEMHDVAVAAMTKTDFPSYGHWLAQGATVTWEQWDGANSRNHPMFGGALTWFYRYLAGVTVTADGAGYRHFYVKPYPTPGLDRVHYSKMTPQGPMAVDVVNSHNAMTIDVTVPVGSKATVCLPDGTEKTVLQGRHVLHGKYKTQTPASEETGV